MRVREPQDQIPAESAYVDWEFAKSTGRRLVSSGPAVSTDEAAAIVGSIRAAAARAQEPIAQTTRMHAPGLAPAALVIDRPTWINLNVDSMAALMGPVFAKVMADQTHQVSPKGLAIGAKVAGAEAGALLSFMASKILGQYDLAPQGTPRLLLVAPNLVAIQRELDVDAQDFRAWVCMRERRTGCNYGRPWLRDRSSGPRARLGDGADARRAGRPAARHRQAPPQALGSGGGGLADLIASPEQRERIAAVTAVMALLEGHADVMMDEVGPTVIPSVAQIREKFTERRKGAGALDRLLRRLLGLEAKMAQYRDGAVFVRSVIEQVGLDDFNAVWTSPETLPKPAEIHDPAAWVRRVHA